MYLVIMSSTLILMYNNYHLAIHKKILKKPINLITMSMNLFKIWDIGFVKFYADFVYIKAILSLHDISSVEQWTEMVQFYLWKGIS